MRAVDFIGCPSPAGGERESSVASTFMQDFKRFFFRGLAAVMPTVLTIALLVWLFNLVWVYAASPINEAIKGLLSWALEAGYLSGWWRENLFEKWDAYKLSWMGFILAVVAIYIFGRFVGSFFGRWIWRRIEGGFFRMPVIKAVYPQVKQVTDFLLSERKIPSSRVVAVEYPRKGIWSIGLVTSPGLRTIQESTHTPLLSIFIPSSPTPVTGYTITARADEVIELPMTIDEALRFTVSGGVIVPPQQAVPEMGDVREDPQGPATLNHRQGKEHAK
jgi:uncharacterized membrane protein